MTERRNHLHYSARAARAAVTLLLLSACHQAKSQVNGLPPEEFRWQHAVPAEPYSSINTATGTLVT